MLREFVTENRAAIVTKARGILTARPAPSATAHEINNGVPLFLSQLAGALRSAKTGAPASQGAIGSAATRRGADLLALGFTVSQVVHDYGDICQAVTELALERHAPITTAEFQTLNACLDTAIAEAVTEHARLTAASRSTADAGQRQPPLYAARNAIEAARHAFEALRVGKVAINGSTAGVVTRSLGELEALVGAMIVETEKAAKR